MKNEVQFIKVKNKTNSSLSYKCAKAYRKVIISVDVWILAMLCVITFKGLKWCCRANMICLVYAYFCPSIAHKTRLAWALFPVTYSAVE